MDYRTISIWVAVGVFIFVIAYDIFPAKNKVPGDTISEIIHYASIKWWIIPMFWGALIGHWFWRAEYEPWKFPSLLVLLGVLCTLNYLTAKVWDVWPVNFQSIWFVLIGLVIGHVLWPLGKYENPENLHKWKQSVQEYILDG